MATASAGASVWIGPFAAAAGLLAGAGALKAARPHATARALKDMGLPGRLSLVAGLVRVGGAAEAVVGGAALLAGASALRLLAITVAASYVGFAAVVAFALAKGTAVSSCGCFGATDTPPTVAHVVVDVGAALTAVAVAMGPGGGLPGVLARQPLAGIPLVLLLVVACYLAWLALTALPRAGARAVTALGGRRP
ncbi:MAG: hypothetical protein E6G27_13835 [Actinobacteria bacterium]|nr:MAG: hypothetical protein E6G27_13835 [Actinomycetota bacterium]